MKGYSLPASLDKDIDELKDLIERFKDGKVTPIEVKAHRVPFGVYEQREHDTYMVRIRCAGGYIEPHQLERVAQLSSKYGMERIHLTTRQEVQIHYVGLDDIVSIIKELKKIGLTSRGGGGNTVRNIIAQEDAGINSDDTFDVTPYAVALTTRLIEESDSWNLPRKFKIAFSGSFEDKGYATVADLGFIAKIKDSKKGFKVYVAGGFGAKPQVANLLFDFITADEVYAVAKAVKSLFWKYGNRKNKHAARLRFLWRSLGEVEFKRRFQEEYEAVKEKNYPPLAVEEIENQAKEPGIGKEEPLDSEDFKLWKSRFVLAQRQKDLLSIVIPIELGFIDNDKVIKLAQFLKHFGDNTIRLTKDQNFLIRNINVQYLANVYNFLKNTLADFNRPLICDKLISCAGASTCQLGICLSRGVARAIIKKLQQSKLDLDKISDLKINISGCPNACGQHVVADLGFFGKAVRKNGRLYPAYNVVVGAVVEDEKTKFADRVSEISAKDLPKLVEDFFCLYLSKSDQYKNFKEYVGNGAREDLIQISDKYKDIPDFEEDKNYYFDWGANEEFSLASRGSGECSAGIFDLIEMDRVNIQKTEKELSQTKEEDKTKKDLILKLVFYACRVLLITRGAEPKEEEGVYDNFCEHFIKTGLVDSDFKNLVKAARSKNYDELVKRKVQAKELAERVNFLYDKMDNSFQFQVSTPSQAKTKQPSVLEEQAKASFEGKPKEVKDFRGVVCPMNFVKTKIELAKLKPGEVLKILLDDGEPIENVPGSVKAEGHKILKQEKVGNHWSVVIEKV